MSVSWASPGCHQVADQRANLNTDGQLVIVAPATVGVYGVASTCTLVNTQPLTSVSVAVAMSMFVYYNTGRGALPNVQVAPTACSPVSVAIQAAAVSGGCTVTAVAATSSTGLNVMYGGVEYAAAAFRVYQAMRRLGVGDYLGDEQLHA